MSFQIAVIGNMHCWSKERWVRVKGRYLMTVIWYQVYCVLFLHMNKSSTDLSSMSICTCFEIVCQSQTWGYSCISCFYFLLKRNLTFTSSRHKLALFDIHLTTSKKDHHQQQTKTNGVTNCFVFVKRQWLHGVHREISWRCSDWLSTEMCMLFYFCIIYTDFHSVEIIQIGMAKACTSVSVFRASNNKLITFRYFNDKSTEWSVRDFSSWSFLTHRS